MPGRRRQNWARKGIPIGVSAAAEERRGRPGKYGGVRGDPISPLPGSATELTTGCSSSIYAAGCSRKEGGAGKGRPERRTPPSVWLCAPRAPGCRLPGFPAATGDAAGEAARSSLGRHLGLLPPLGARRGGGARLGSANEPSPRPRQLSPAQDAAVPAQDLWPALHAALRARCQHWRRRRARRRGVAGGFAVAARSSCRAERRGGVPHPGGCSNGGQTSAAVPGAASRWH